MVCAAAPMGRRRRIGRRRRARGDSRETHILDDALVHEADEAVQRLLLREPVGFGEDAEEIGVRRAVAVAGRAGEEVEDARARLVLVQELDDRRENVMGHVLMGDVAEEVEERLGELGAGLRGGGRGGRKSDERAERGGGGSRSSVARCPKKIAVVAREISGKGRGARDAGRGGGGGRRDAASGVVAARTSVRIAFLASASCLS